MTIGTHAVGTLPCSARLAPVTAARFADILRDYAVLLEVDAYPLTGGYSVTYMGIAGNPIGAAPIAAPGQTRTYTRERTRLRFSDRGYISLPGDVPAATPWPARLESLVVERSVTLSPDDPADGAQAADAGLIATGGGLDTIVATTVVDGRPARVRIVPRTGSLDAARTVFEGVVEGWATGADTIGVRLSDYSFLLETPVQESVYGGTGGADGTAEVAGRIKPLCYGRVTNMTPPLIVPTLLIYQVHDGAVHAVDAVYDSGLALALDTAVGTAGDCADYAALAGATIAAGKYATCKALGLFRLNATPGGLVTADVRGDSGGGYVDTIPLIAERVLRRLGLTGGEYDASAFAVLALDCPWEGGILIDQAGLSGRAALQRLLAGIGCGWYARRDRRIRPFRLTPPTLAEVVADFGAVELLDLQEIAPPETLYPPTWRRRVAYGANWTVQTSDLAGGVGDARRAELAEPYRVAEAADSVIRTAHLRARDPAPLISHLAGASGAIEVAQRLQALHGTPRRMFEGTVKARVGLPIEMNACVRLTWPRYGLSGGRLMRAFPVREDYAARTVTVLFWG